MLPILLKTLLDAKGWVKVIKMHDRHVKALIIDPMQAQANFIEKMLNVMGYCCVANTASVEEGLLLNRYGLRNFDILIAPLSVLVLEHTHVTRFKGFNIKNLFLYGCAPDDQDVPILVRGEACFKSGLPQYEVLKAFMRRLTNGTRMAASAPC